jgi:hypothetical protein
MTGEKADISTQLNKNLVTFSTYWEQIVTAGGPFRKAAKLAANSESPLPGRASLIRSALRHMVRNTHPDHPSQT